jgi:hypothetical protein
MKNQMLFSAALAVTLVLSAHSQPAGQPQDTQDTIAAQGMPSAGVKTPPVQQDPLPAGVQKQVQTPLVMDTNLLNNPSRQLGAVSNQFGYESNQVGLAADQFTTSSNEFGTLSNTVPMTPTGREYPPRVYTTNEFSPTNKPQVTIQDRADSVADQKLLLRLRQIFRPTAPSTEAWASAVHFISREGVVTLVGYVPTQQERKRVEDAVQQVPGVVQVIDHLQVTLPPDAQSNAPNSALTIYIPTGTNQLGVESYLTAEAQGTNQLPAASTNLTPTGPANPMPRVYGTDNLPPELLKRQQPPPR